MHFKIALKCVPPCQTIVLISFLSVPNISSVSSSRLLYSQLNVYTLFYAASAYKQPFIFHLRYCSVLPARVVGKGECVDSSRVALQVKGSHHLSEVSSFAKANLPHLHIRSEAAGRDKPEQRDEARSELPKSDTQFKHLFLFRFSFYWIELKGKTIWRNHLTGGKKVDSIHDFSNLYFSQQQFKAEEPTALTVKHWL